MAGAATPATTRLEKAGVPFRVHAYTHDAGAAYGPEAAEAWGSSPRRVFKTLVAEVDGALTVAIVPVTAKLDLKALAAAVAGSGRRWPRSRGRAGDRLRCRWHLPLGQRKRLPTVLDASAEAFETVFCSAGRRGLEIELAPADLVRLIGARWPP